MKVKAASGTKCPKEDNPRRYIDDKTAVEVRATAYYRRLVAEGSLIKMEDEKGGGE